MYSSVEFILVPFITKKWNTRKGAIESNHRLLRYIVYPRKELGNQILTSLFRIIYGDEILNRLNITSIESKNINLTSSLLVK